MRSLLEVGAKRSSECICSGW